MSLSPSSRVVVIGGAGGIGLAVARAAADAGARVIVASRTEQSLRRALAVLPAAEGRRVDVTSAASLASFFAGTGAFDHLVYTAGDELVRGTIADYDPRRAQRFFDVRLFRALDAVRAALPTLSRTGSITLTAGAAALRGGPGRLLGAAVGGAVITAARSLAVELAPIRVNVVAPGVVPTPLWSDLPDDARQALFAKAADGAPLGRLAEPADVAKAYVALMDQDYVTGNLTVVDSGSTLG